ncbi:hypothetical protein TrVFT333_010134 [Trichoderma virens FT-333]|nr:hypothetical protein TrVFT333_010134 [Trichoderma virens FT-333]
MKRYLDPDDFEGSGHVASKRVCLQLQNPLAEDSQSSEELQTYTIDPTYNIDLPFETGEVFDQFLFGDQMYTNGDETPCFAQEDSTSLSPDTCDIKSTCPPTVPTGIDKSQPDTCFGVIVAAATSSFKSQDGTTQVPVTLETCNTKLKLLSQDSQKYAGIINDAALARVLQEFTIKVDAKLLIPTTLRKRSSKTLPKEIYSPVNCDVRIIFYGLAADQNTIGNILGDAGLYFQHPLPSKYNSNVRYWNPHYLLRPGSQMPTPEEAEEDPGTRCDRAMESDLLNTSNEGRFMRLFDEASDSNLKTNIEPSRRLRPTLKEHQISALAWLTGIEARGIRDGVSSLWEPVSGSFPTKEYQHKITRNRKPMPEIVPGGVLADEMGLGKSLSILALICSSLDTMEAQKTGSEETQSRQSWTTLIVTPKSTIHNWQQQCESTSYQDQGFQNL